VKRAIPFRLLGAFALAVAVSLLAHPAAAEEKSLLSADGTLYQVHSGLAADLGVAGADLAPDDYVIEWAARRQDGSVRVGIVPGTQDYNVKRNLDLAFDEASQSLLLLWKEEVTPLTYFALMGENSPYRRFDDIWFGVIFKKICDHLGLLISCGRPFVRHSRASDPLVNLVKEAPGVGFNETFWEKVDGIVLKAPSPAECMLEVGEGLQRLPDPYMAKLGKAIGVWAGLFN